MSSDYCKYNPQDPTCFGGAVNRTFVQTNRREQHENAVSSYKPPPRRDFRSTDLNDPLPPRRDFRPMEEPAPRRNFMPTEENTFKPTTGPVQPALAPRRNFMPTEGGTMERSHEPRSKKIRQRIEDENRFQNSAIPTQDLIQFKRMYNKKLAQGKKRALDFVKIGQEEVIEPRDQHKYGHMTEAAYKNAYKGRKAAMNQLKEGGKYIEELNGFEIRPEFSDYDYIALHNRTTGERVQVGRGSDTDFMKADKNIEQAFRGKPLTQRLRRGVNDWIVNAKFMMKKHLDTDTYRNQENDLLKWAREDGVEVKSIKQAGHSKAGATGEYLARKYGSEAHIFNPATHPTSELIANENVHPDTRINVYREEFDPVSGARVYKKTPEFMKVNTYTTPPGAETEIVGRHDHSHAIPKPSRIEDGKVLAIRNTKFKNRVSFAGAGVYDVATAGVKGAVMALPAIAFQPEYDDPTERTYRKAELGIDMARGIAEFEGVSQLGLGAGARGIGRFTSALAPSAAIGAYTDLLMMDQEDNVPLHEALGTVRHAIFGADAPEPEFVYAPKYMKYLMLPERKRQEAAREREYEIYKNDFLVDPFDLTGDGIVSPGDDAYLTFDGFLERYGDADGYLHQQQVEALGFMEEAREEQSSNTVGALEDTPLETFVKDGKTYVEDRS